MEELKALFYVYMLSAYVTFFIVGWFISYYIFKSFNWIGGMVTKLYNRFS